MEEVKIDNLNFISLVRNQMIKNKLIFSYKGEMSHEISLALLNLAEDNLNLGHAENTIKSRVFSVMVECLQNITQHGEKTQTGSDVFMIGQSEKGFVMFSGNVIKTEKVSELKERLLRINTMSEEELKSFYRFWIANNSLSSENRIGLGLIQVARKTGNPLDFDFKPIDSDTYFFTLQTVVGH